jgi:hypothetical protein
MACSRVKFNFTFIHHRMWLPSCVVTSVAHCECLEAEVADLNPVKWYVQNVFSIYVIVGTTRQAMYKYLNTLVLSCNHCS